MGPRFLTFLAWLSCGGGATLILADTAARATTNCSVNCYNYTDFCDGGESDECTKYVFSQGHFAHSPASSGSTLQSQAPSMNGVSDYTWGMGLCDTGGGYGVNPEICTCGGMKTNYPNVTRWLCVYVSSSS